MWGDEGYLAVLLLTQKGLEGIQVVGWPRDTKSALPVLGVRGGGRRRIVWQMVLI